ncbi:anti-sigma factor RsbA family regulatory protein [Streptomyces beijiangensis]|uniref:Sensor histidine kinase n=1 Tax=Streptomyces beijiangensis TaxID=163361 RepID=A0A939F5A1_9ACTN|nr:anti-sigma factor RsbA family regulatory protein [Streptomyces beijiangensis]MBO0511989.1 sensor histidine kinase [Streptomyces beijiangensis]
MSTVAPTESFVHPALFYRGHEQYVAGTVPFVLDGLAAGEPVAVAVPGPQLELIRAELGARADAVHFVDMPRAGRNPGRIIPGVLRAFADGHRDKRVRIIGEPIWAGRTSLEYPACVQHEALINTAFRGRDVTILCPYDVDRLDATVLTDAYATHPVVIENGRELTSSTYDPDHIVARYNEPLAAPSAGAAEMAFTLEELVAARHFAVRHAQELGLDGGTQLGDLALVVAELTTNSVVHGGGSGTLWVWGEGRQLVCQVRDSGTMEDPLAGRRPPARGQRGGRGLLMVHHLGDLVRVHTSKTGTTIRCYLHN